jgi:hypothetical protein
VSTMIDDAGGPRAFVQGPTSGVVPLYAGWLAGSLALSVVLVFRDWHTDRAWLVSLGALSLLSSVALLGRVKAEVRRGVRRQPTRVDLLLLAASSFPVWAALALSRW